MPRNCLVCSFTDRQGNDLTYAFGPNDDDTVVETYFKKNGRSVVSEPGSRNVWRLSTNRADGLMIIPLDTPGWAISMAPDTDFKRVSGGTLESAAARLLRNGNTFGTGGCGRIQVAPKRKRGVDLGYTTD